MSRDVEEIAASYVEAAEGDAAKALRMAVHDAIGGLADAECRIGEADRLISRGYVRGRITPLGRVLGRRQIGFRSRSQPSIGRRPGLAQRSRRENR
jgi:hypothetical protein